MLENGKDRFIFTKSYEIAYALFRMAGEIEEKDFSERLRSLGGALLQAASGHDYAEASRSLQVVECLAKFAGDVNMISPANANILLGEIYTLDAAIIEYRNAANRDRINLSDIFSKADPEVTPPAAMAYEDAAINNPAESYPATEAETAMYPATATAGEAPEEPAAAGSYRHESHENAGSVMKAEVRQAAIVDRIRQSGNCRLKDIQEVLPDASERTIRYDLQSLVERNLIERVGHGGPSVFYRAR